MIVTDKSKLFAFLKEDGSALKNAQHQVLVPNPNYKGSAIFTAGGAFVRYCAGDPLLEDIKRRTKQFGGVFVAEDAATLRTLKLKTTGAFFFVPKEAIERLGVQLRVECSSPVLLGVSSGAASNFEGAIVYGPTGPTIIVESNPDAYAGRLSHFGNSRFKKVGNHYAASVELTGKNLIFIQ